MMDPSAHLTHDNFASSGGHGGHDMPMPMPDGPKCAMNMLWNTQIEDTCIVFRSWHISSKTSFVVSCLVIAALGVLYEYLRELQRAYDVRVALRLGGNGKAKSRSQDRASGRATPDMEGVGLLSGKPASMTVGTLVPLKFRTIRAALYASTIALSFFLMLVFMTYNAYLIAAVIIGAGLGHYIFGSTMNVEAVLNDASRGRSMACH